MNKKIPRVVLCFLIGIIAVATFQLRATPNGGPYTYIPGDGISEAIGDFSQLEILQEHLDFDLRSLKNEEHPQITATYQVQNSGQPVEIEILFVAPGSKKASVSLDGATIPFTTILEPNLPREWQVPRSLPSAVYPGGSSSAHYRTHSYDSALSFTTAFPTGVSELRVSYAMQPGTDRWGFYRDYHIAYILAPAKAWKAFGNLEVEVKLAPDWRFVTTLPMEQVDNTLTATFEGIPADYLIVTAAPPEPEPKYLRIFNGINNFVTLISYVLPLLGFFGCCYLACRTAVLFRRLNWGFIPGAIAVIFLMLLDTFILLFEIDEVNKIVTFNVKSWLLEQQQGIPYYALYLDNYDNYIYSDSYFIFTFVLWGIILLATPILFAKVRCNRFSDSNR
jgi:hypothetical protein